MLRSGEKLLKILSEMIYKRKGRGKSSAFDGYAAYDILSEKNVKDSFEKAFCKRKIDNG